ncbi:thiol reductant ABC exporter subunit CydD [Actinoallomurus rhizosphaericola]|uniref:thiol reductant ABC exporter subunit CydD n=1 Tax=Actinoallomurus rhizosphaericola TaxID=2952536 RepID=UPI0020922FB7|nr:thiol reductant ABC exporter subunit CydD [Actinoallomurus rhizosphaericola]MCO5994875.1 thiol reductant ABC exporter subunit CydD [Actinoallomurus rhizosphaericola]
MAYLLFALAQGLLVVAQADLLSRVLAGGAPLLPLTAVLTGRAVLLAGQGGVFRWTAARRKEELRRRLLRAGGPAADVTLLGRGLDALDPFYAGYLPQRYAAAVIPLAVLIRLVAADWPSALVIAVTLPLIPVFGALVGWRTREATRRQWGLLHRLGGHFLDVVTGLPTLRAYGRDEAQTEVVRAMADGHRRATVRTLRIAFLSSFVLEVIGTLSVALVAVPAGLRLLNGSIGLRTALLVLLLAPEAYLPLRLLGTRFHAAAEGRAVLDQVAEILAEPDAPRSLVGTEERAGPAAKLRESGDPRPPAASERPPAVSERRAAVSERRAARIEVRDLVVRYAGAGAPALDGLSLTVEPGERVALSGPSGAGKTTLLRAVLGFVVPESGRILVDGHDLAELDLTVWRSRVAYVPQRPHLFAGTVADNIRLGRPDAEDDAVRAAAEAAAAHEFITALPGGYDAPIGERGLGLSTGQRQRIAIARAHLMDAPIVVLDEPTARLDLAAEAAVADAAARLLDGRTGLLVAHRPALLSIADRVVRLNGREVCAC